MKDTYSIQHVIYFQANSSPLCNTILDVMSSIYHQDNANYFILESQHTLSQFAEKIYNKSPDVQVCLSVTYAFLPHTYQYIEDLI